MTASGDVVKLPDQVLEKIPLVVWAAAATAPIFVPLYCPVTTYVKVEASRVPVVSSTVPWIVVDTDTLSPTCVRMNGPMHTVVADGAQVCPTKVSPLKLKFEYGAARLRKLLIATLGPGGDGGKNV